VGGEPLQTFVLDDRARPFLREQLAGINALCSILLELIEQTPGEVWTLAPAETPSERLYRFHEGGLLAANLDFSRAIKAPDGWIMPVESLRDLRADALYEALGAAPNACLLFDDVNSIPSDDHLANDPAVVFLGDDVYRLVLPGADRALVGGALADCDTLWHGVSVVCRPDVPITRSDISTPEALRSLAVTAVEFDCRAYDGEGFVAWRRRADDAVCEPDRAA
jgi:hypothetical protein